MYIIKVKTLVFWEKNLIKIKKTSQVNKPQNTKIKGFKIKENGLH